jgi:hypothetical protein
MAYKIWDNVNGLRDATAEETIEIDAKEKAYTDNGANRKLTQIKEIRLQKLKETDWWVLRGTMTDAQKDFRQNLRDIPANHTDEATYDLLLARDALGNLTHNVWSKP